MLIEVRPDRSIAASRLRRQRLFAVEVNLLSTILDNHLHLLLWQPFLVLQHTEIMSATAAKSKNYFESLTEYGESALDNGWVPDAVLRPVVRKLNQVRLNEINKGKAPSQLTPFRD